jgi:dCTP deaminase
VILTAGKLVTEIVRGNQGDVHGIAVIPEPDLGYIREKGEASIPLRLGRWLVSMRQSNETAISVTHDGNDRLGRVSKQHFVPFAHEFVLHPGRFVLASTLEWIRLPQTYGAFVGGKSTLGRRGIVIETAAGVHPGFCGCLTLEIANVGEVPVKLVSGMMIGQLYVHLTDGPPSITSSSLASQRKPRLGDMKEDLNLQKLKKTEF